MHSIDTIIESLKAGTQDFYSEPELRKKLSKKKSLTIKLGADPTAGDLHLGHAVVLSKLRQFQDLGHTVVFLIGDFTARIGDPTGRSKTRPPLTPEEIETNAKTYLDQVTKIVDPTKLKIVYNSSWLSAVNLADWITICAKVTVAQVIERDDFSKRLQDGNPIGMHELLYPLLQGYDSVALHADVELGGSDQLFNLLMGRKLQEQYNQEPQVVITTPILEGLDGVQKMSKSYNNYISLQESAANAYGKLMSISDTLMWRYYAVLLHKTPAEISAMQANEHPMAMKKSLAFTIIKKFWSESEAMSAQHSFSAVIQSKNYEQSPEIHITNSQSQSLLELLKQLPHTLSNSDLRRRIQAGAISINGDKIFDPHTMVNPTDGMIVKIGKHDIFKLKL